MSASEIFSSESYYDLCWSMRDLGVMIFVILLHSHVSQEPPILRRFRMIYTYIRWHHPQKATKLHQKMAQKMVFFQECRGWWWTRSSMFHKKGCMEYHGSQTLTWDLRSVCCAQICRKLQTACQAVPFLKRLWTVSPEGGLPPGLASRTNNRLEPKILIDFDI